MSALLIGPEQREVLRDLRERAAAEPVDIRTLAQRIASPWGKRAHMAQMTAQTVVLPVGYFVTFSIETGHPCGVARHLSMSSERVHLPGHVPHPEVVWMVAEELGFSGGLETCFVYKEELRGHDGLAINVVQPIGAGKVGSG